MSEVPVGRRVTVRVPATSANLGAKALTQPVSDWVTPKIEERIAGTVEKTLEKKGQESSTVYVQ